MRRVAAISAGARSARPRGSRALRRFCFLLSGLTTARLLVDAYPARTTEGLFSGTCDGSARLVTDARVCRKARSFAADNLCGHTKSTRLLRIKLLRRIVKARAQTRL